MHSYTLISTALALLSVPIGATAFSPVSSNPILISHITVLSNRTFEATKAAIEATIPPLGTTYATLLRSGDLTGAAAALATLPVLNHFILPARDFGLLTTIVGLNHKAVQYEIGNPHTALLTVQYQLGIALYAPIRVALLEDPNTHVVQFIFDSPLSTFGQYGDWRVDAVAVELTKNLTQVLLTAGGW